MRGDRGRCGILFPNEGGQQFWVLKETRSLSAGECVSVRIMWGNTSPRFVPNRIQAFYTENKWSCWPSGAGPFVLTLSWEQDLPGWSTPGPKLAANCRSLGYSALQCRGGGTRICVIIAINHREGDVYMRGVITKSVYVYSELWSDWTSSPRWFLSFLNALRLLVKM